mgnify:CR=1 FL=1
MLATAPVGLPAHGMFSPTDGDLPAVDSYLATESGEFIERGGVVNGWNERGIEAGMNVVDEERV